MARVYISNIVQAMEDGLFFVEGETPTGSVNGSNTSFTLAEVPNPVGSLVVLINGMVMTLTEDYSLSGDTLTLVFAPPTGSIIRVNYRVVPS